ncbi:putative transmembrane protein 42 [Skeletonema marinoi]|uniref:Transmembrane protein 42 n=1 Tax=Skeletonema marinoi TaxID=267567 RepID=A0AAD8Y3N0_9STRA|nr:putative transmembrane protein 42 [Skeletonema marinoi]
MPINKRAIISGALGATASSIGKLALSPKSPVPSTFHSYCHIILNRYYQHENDIGWICPYVSLGTRVVCFLCMIGVNLLMVSSFLDGMNESGSVVGTALSTAANFSFSALYGILFFEEHVPISWFFGATLIALGMYLLSSVTLTTDDDDDDDDDDKTKTD